MIVLPAIDLKNGKAVRLKQGKKDDETIYNDNPVEVAKYFNDIGADYIHIVDLDGAFDGKPKNLTVIKNILNSTDIPIEIGGGIRDYNTAKEYIDSGVSRIIIGTKAVEDLDFINKLVEKFGDKIAISLDCYDNFVATKGWTEKSEVSVYDLAKQLEDIGVKNIIYTDISRDGMLTEPNYEVLKNLNNNFNFNVTASGGIASEEQLDKCSDLDLYGAITGKAIYEKRIDLENYLKKRENC